MELFKEILIKLLEKEEISVVFPNLKIDTARLVELESYGALQKIKAVIQDDSLSDFACVERIVCVFEELGSGGGCRHDF